MKWRDHEDFKDESEFREYLSDNKLTIKKYFLENYNKKDLLTGATIPYTNAERYMLLDFVNKRNLATWIKQEDKEKVAQYLAGKIKNRIKKDNWKFFPSQCELRDLKDLPALNVLFAAGISIGDISDLPQRYVYDNVKFVEKDQVIYIDTREQKPLSFNRSEVLKLAYGDYGSSISDTLFIERKSINDLWGTLSKGYGRFSEEINRANEDGAYIVVVVDYQYAKAQSYNYNKKFSKASAQFIFKRMRELMQEYDNVQFVFSGGRNESKRVIRSLFSMGENFVRTHDIQFYIDKKVLEKCGMQVISG